MRRGVLNENLADSHPARTYTLDMDIAWVSTARDRDVRDGLLTQAGLAVDGDVTRSVLLYDGDMAVGTASRKDNVLKWFAINPSYQGQGLVGMLLTPLATEAIAAGISRLFLVTKPGNVVLFRPFGFFLIAETSRMALLENRKDGLSSYLAALEGPRTGRVGAIVMHANPFTLGHRYLVEQASRRCDALHLFVLSTPGGPWTSAERLSMVTSGCEDVGNVFVHASEEYLVSPATFPTYFLKDGATGAQAELDIAIFLDKVVPALGIKVRFVGTELEDLVTSAYNKALKEALPSRGVEVVEIPRLVVEGKPVSASRVRAYLGQGKVREAAVLVPDTTRPYLVRARTSSPLPRR